MFAAIRVISAVFLKDTLEAARNDDETLVIERLRNKQKYVQKLQEVFHAIGGSVDGLITEERLASILESPKALAYFQTLDLDVTETSALFSCGLGWQSAAKWCPCWESHMQCVRSRSLR